MYSDEEQRQIEQLVARLIATHPEVAADRVEAVVHDAHARFDTGPIRDFVPLLVERAANTTLSDRVST